MVLARVMVQACVMVLARVIVLACVSPCYGVQDKVNMPQDFWYIYIKICKKRAIPPAILMKLMHTISSCGGP